MRLFTGKGDQGSTDLLGDRVGKDDPRIAALGELDESTSSIGFARSVATQDRTRDHLLEAQRDLYRIMAELAFTDELRPAGYALSADRVTWLETLTDQLSAEVALPPHFIIPGDTMPSAALDVARTVVRRAERVLVTLANGGHLGNTEILRYMNRLSSLLFMLARFEDQAAGVTPIRAKQ